MWGRLPTKFIVPILLLILSSSMITSLAAVPDNPVQFDGGNYYQVVETSDIDWEVARDDAAAMEYLGCAGHLAVITSEEENAFLLSTFDPTVLHTAWLGGFQNPPDTIDPAANWEWVTGEAWDVTLWGAGEPNDLEGPASEMYLNYWYGQDGVVWNDDDNTTVTTAYVVEFEYVEGQCGAPPLELDCSLAGPSIDVIWPPNHNMQPVTISGVGFVDNGAEIPEDSQIAVNITAIGSSEADNGQADGNTTGDYGGENTDTAWVRAERAGNGSGRTYTIDFEAATDGAAGCTGTVTVFVPHDQSAKSVNSDNAADTGSSNAQVNDHANNGQANANDHASNGKNNANDHASNGKGNANGHGNPHN